MLVELVRLGEGGGGAAHHRREDDEVREVLGDPADQVGDPVPHGPHRVVQPGEQLGDDGLKRGIKERY